MVVVGERRQEPRRGGGSPVSSRQTRSRQRPRLATEPAHHSGRSASRDRAAAQEARCSWVRCSNETLRREQDRVKKRGCTALVAAALVWVTTACGAESNTAEDTATCTVTQNGQGGTTRLTATLTGAGIVHTAPDDSPNVSGVPNKGDPDGTGCATVTLDVGKIGPEGRVDAGGLCYEVSVQGVDRVDSIYVYQGAAGTNGQYAAILFASFGESEKAPGLYAGCREQERCQRGPCLDRVIAEMAANPENFYVQVHTDTYPHSSAVSGGDGPIGNGALRGQLSR